MTMRKVNVHEAKTHLSRWLVEVENGETIILCRRNQPVAEIRPLALRRSTKRPLGLASGTFAVPPSFFEPLPDELLDSFEPRPKKR
jgi:antitoxin (DNA-binding transcriptional repressor) of toxin-antitoxin stability system